MNPSKSLVNIDVTLLVSSLVLMIIGILFIFSSGVNASGELVSDEYLKQIIWVSLSILVLISMTFIKYSLYKEYSLWLYLLVLVLLAIPLFGTKTVNGAKSWLGIGGLGIQPSEFTKIATIFMLATFLERNKDSIHTLKTFIKGLSIVAVPMVIILRQPDLGTSLVFVPIYFLMLFVAGAKARHLLYFALLGSLSILFTVLPFIDERIFNESSALLIPIVDPLILGVLLVSLLIVLIISVVGLVRNKQVVFYWIIYGVSILILSMSFAYIFRIILHEYQILRLVVFIDPSIDQKGAGWNIIQSMTAVGSGGFFGKGFLQGTQSHYRFLPMQSTDFIFSILAEELGFIGILLIFLLYGIIFYRMIRIIQTTKSLFAIYSIAGIVAMIFTHFFVNIGMTMGIMPVTGIPLYFLSYGGSSLLAATIGVGFCANVNYNRYNF